MDNLNKIRNPHIGHAIGGVINAVGYGIIR